jgi:hypothetical protein
MPVQNSGIPSPYGPASTPLDSFGVPLTDANVLSGANVVPSQASSILTGTNPTSATSPLSAGGYTSVPAPVLSAILAELRVISNLLNMNSLNNDLNSMRADEQIGSNGGPLN